MSQHIQDHGQPPTTPAPDSTHAGLLRLPPHVRRRIYLFARVARFDGRPYTYYLDGRKESRSCMSDFDPPLGPDPRRPPSPPRSGMARYLFSTREDYTGCRPGLLFSGLLLTCRAIHAEVAALLYSANRFIIFYARNRSLAPLRALSPTALASLVTLKIVLNESACHEPVDSINYPPECCRDGPAHRPGGGRYHCAQYHGDKHGRPLLDDASGSDPNEAKLAVQAMLLEWRNTAAHLSSHIRAGSLALSLVCDFDPRHEYTLEAARLATAPLALLPPLRDCHVRLSEHPSRPLQLLAEEAVLRARSIPSPRLLGPPRTGSPLTSLPRELRHRILEYTDLATPWREVTWGRGVRGYRIVRPPCALSAENGRCPPHVFNGCRLTRCGHCLYCDPDGYELGPNYDCFCRRRHAAFSLSCQCWAPPTSLFLVCRALREDAEFVFFTTNRFIVFDGDTECPWDFLRDEVMDPKAYPYERFAASKFFREIVPAHCLTHLRFVELVFPPYDPEVWPQFANPAQLDWRETIRWLHGKLNAPALTIRFVMAEFYYADVPDIRQQLTKEEGHAIVRGWAGIMAAVSPLVRGDGLGGFYVQAPFPGRWTRAARSRTRWYAPENQWLADTDKNHKEFCERGVRGIQKGEPLPPCVKAEPSKSTWQRLYERDSYLD